MELASQAITGGIISRNNPKMKSKPRKKAGLREYLESRGEKGEGSKW